MIWDAKGEVRQAAERIRDALTRLGYCYRTKNGDLLEISYSRLGLVSDRYGVIEVDVQRLPPRVSIDRLAHANTLHHLTAVVGKPVHKLNTTGLTYCVELQPGPRRQLPRKVRLDVNDRPPGAFMIPVGQGPSGGEWRSLLDTSHILVGGESRSGKSTWLNAVLVALLATYKPEDLRLAIIDPKGVDFTPFCALPHLLKPVADTPEAASAVTGALVVEMDRRRELFARVFARNLQMFNERAGEAGLKPLPLVLVIVDEVADIALQCGLNSTFYRNLIRLSSKGAAFGLIMILATQNPKAEVLNTLIRGNMSTRVAFRVNSAEHSRTILGCSGAQHLPRTIRGRLAARLDESLIHLQGYYVPDEDVLALTRRWAGNAAPALTPVERALVRFACDELAGGFPVHRLYEQFKGETSYRQIVALAKRWQGSGWLLPPPSAVEPRQVSDELRAIATEDGAR